MCVWVSCLCFENFQAAAKVDVNKFLFSPNMEAAELMVRLLFRCPERAFRCCILRKNRSFSGEVLLVDWEEGNNCLFYNGICWRSRIIYKKKKTSEYGTTCISKSGSSNAIAL